MIERAVPLQHWLGWHRSDFGSAAHLLGGQAHRLDNALVAGAAANVARKCRADLFLFRFWILFEESVDGHDKAGRAETTLHAVAFPEGLLHGMQFATGRQ